MKKILLLLCALLGITAGAMAAVTQPTLTTDPSNPTYYLIQNFRSGKYANYAGASAQLQQVATADAGVSSLWYFVANGEGVSIVPATAPDLKLASTTSATADGAVWYLPENPYKSGVFCVSLTSGATANCWDDQGGHTTIGYWQPAANDNEGTSWNIVEIAVTKSEVDAGTVDLSWALTKLDVLARLAPLASLSVYTDANIAAVRNATNETEMNNALKAFEANISLFCRSNKYLVVGESACSYVSSPTGYEEAIQLESAGNGNFYLKGYKSEKYIGNVTISQAINTDATPTTAFYFQSYNGYTVVRPSDTAASYDGYRYIHNGGSGCVGWEPAGTNTQHTIAEVELPAELVNVTYHLMVGSVEKAQASVECGVGDAPAVPSALQYDFTSFSYDVEAIAATTTDVYVTPTFNLPFATSADFDNAKWYYLHGHGNRQSDYISTNGTDLVWANGKSNTDAYKWAFFGDPISGIQVVNKASGTGSYLTNTDPATMAATAYSWPIKKQTNTSLYSGNNGFGLYDTSRSQYINAQGSTLKYWGSFDAGSTFWVEEVPDISVNVTFNLLIGGDVVNTIAQTDVPGNTTIPVPSALTANYSSLAYDFTGNEDVNVGETDLVVNVTATLKAGVVTDLTQLSNAKSYTLTTERGSLYIKNSHLASNSNANVGAAAGSFAILLYEGNYYLYSADANKFVLSDGSLSEAPTSDMVPINMTAQTIKPLYLMVLGSKGLNVTNTNDDYELAINTYVTPDPGNRYAIIQANDFDATNAIAALEEYFHPAAQTQFAEAIAKLKAINFGTGLNQYSFTGEYASYTSQAETIINGLEAQGYSDDNLLIAQALLANYAINLPTAGFYRIKGNTSGMYLAAGNASNGKYAMSDAVDATTIFYFDGSILTNLSTGLNNGMNSGSWDWVVGNPSEVTFQDGNTNGGYGILSKDAYFYDNGDGTSSADRGKSASMTDGNLRYRSWQLEAVSSFDFPVTISEAGYATLCAPVALTIPAGVTANTLTLATDGKTLVLSPVGDAIPAGTPVLLEGTQGSYSFATTDGVPAIDAANLLVGTYPAIQAPVASYVLQNQSGEVGFYQVDDVIPSVRGFRAYLIVSSPVKAFFFGEADGISAVAKDASAKDATIFNIAGQRVAKAQKGIYIVNGKKVLVK